MTAWKGLTRRQAIWLIDRQVEGVDRAVADTIASTPQPKPSDSQARRILETRAGIAPFSLAAVKVATRPLSDEAVDAIQKSMGYCDSSIHPVDAMPRHEDLPHPDLGGLRLWEAAQPSDEGTVPVELVGPVLNAAFSLPGRDRLLLSRASGIDQTTLSRMTRGSCRGVTRANLRILAHVLGLSPRVLGLDGRANVDPRTDRPDIRYAGPFVGHAGLVTTGGAGVGRPGWHDAAAAAASSRSEDAGRRNAVDHAPPTDDQHATRPDRRRCHVRIIDRADAHGRTAGVEFVVDPDGGSRFSLLGRMTAERLDAIAAALGATIRDHRSHKGGAWAAEIDFEGDDRLAAAAHAALVGPLPNDRRRGRSA